MKLFFDKGALLDAKPVTGVPLNSEMSQMPSWVTKPWAQAFGCTIEIQEISIEKCSTMRLTLLIAELLTCQLVQGFDYATAWKGSYHGTRRKSGIDQFLHLLGHLFATNLS